MKRAAIRNQTLFDSAQQTEPIHARDLVLRLRDLHFRGPQKQSLNHRRVTGNEIRAGIELREHEQRRPVALLRRLADQQLARIGIAADSTQPAQVAEPKRVLRVHETVLRRELQPAFPFHGVFLDSQSV